MYRAIARWQESGLTQTKFCLGENLSSKTFSSWLRKYRSEKEVESQIGPKVSKTFIPVEVSGPTASNSMPLASGRMELLFPNGVRMSCPSGVDIIWLKSLINF